MPRKTHTHQYHKVPVQFKYGSKYVWACALGNCAHYMPPHLQHMVEGKNSLCWDCGNEFRLSSDSMLEERPRCNNCRLGTIDKKYEQIDLAAIIAHDNDDL